jgi:hypothetical protein
MKSTLASTKQLPCVSILPIVNSSVVKEWFAVSNSQETGVCAAVVRGEDIAAHVCVVFGGGKRGTDTRDSE